MTPVCGVAPFLPAHRPRAAARFWHARGALDDALTIASLERVDAAPTPDGPCGLAAPCSLPAEFIAWLGDDAKSIGRRTANRLQVQARAFARAHMRGHRHPPRAPEEFMSALDRRRLARHYAALPLIDKSFEVDTQSVLRALDLEHTGMSGDTPDAVLRRTRVLAALAEGALGFDVRVDARDLAVASWPALEAVLAAGMAAWVTRNGAQRPDGAHTWIPLP